MACSLKSENLTSVISPFKLIETPKKKSSLLKKAFTVDGSSSDGVEYTLRLHDWAKLFSWSITWAWVKSFFKIERNKLYFTQIILKQNFNYFTFNMFYK